MKIAVYAICKNEEKHVKDFLENVKGADFVVICDTGSTDGTIDIVNDNYFPGLSAHHISVDPFRFDVARNAALALVPADVDVCISLDLDERLSDGWRESIERAWKKFPALTRLTVNYETEGFAPFLHNCRVHTRKGFYWVDPCHEALQAWMTDDNCAVSKSLTIHHKPDLKKPRTRMTLLEAGLAEQPWNRRRMFYYGRECVLQGLYRNGIAWLQTYLKAWAKSGEPSSLESDQAQAFIELAEGCLREKGELISPAAGDQPTPQ